MFIILTREWFVPFVDSESFAPEWAKSDRRVRNQHACLQASERISRKNKTRLCLVTACRTCVHFVLIENDFVGLELDVKGLRSQQ